MLEACARDGLQGAKMTKNKGMMTFTIDHHLLSFWMKYRQLEVIFAIVICTNLIAAIGMRNIVASPLARRSLPTTPTPVDRKRPTHIQERGRLHTY